MKPTALHLKIALLAYYRFRRQCVCVDEYAGADVIVDTGDDIVEVEVKVDKHDLRKGEDRKLGKHNNYLHGFSWNRCNPNRYFFCVPTSLEEIAVAKIEQLNSRYGLILFTERRLTQGAALEDCVVITRNAKKLHDRYPPGQQKLIAKRASSKLITLMQNELRRRHEQEPAE